MSFSASVDLLVANSEDPLLAKAPEWNRISLGSVARIVNGFPLKSELFSKQGGTPVIRIRDVTAGRAGTFYKGPVPDGYWVEPGDIVIGMDGDFNSRIWRGEKALLNQRVCKLEPDPTKIDKQFLAYVLPGYLRLINQETHSITVKHLSSKTIGQIPLPYPSLEDQRRIVVKLDSFFARSSRSRAELEHISHLIERMKQAILAKAFSGELTQNWRDVNATVSSSWQEKYLGEIADIGTGSTPKRGNPRYYDGGSIPWVTSAVVNDPLVERAEEMITPVALEETNCKVFPVGTILVAMYGEGQTRGRVSVLGIAAATNQALAAIRLKDPAYVTQDFILWFLRSNYLALRQKAAGGVQPNLNLGIIKAIPIPVPSIIEQTEIVRRIETAFSHLDRSIAEIDRASTLLDRLEQATLAKAFRGELVDQDEYVAETNTPPSVEQLREDTQNLVQMGLTFE